MRVLVVSDVPDYESAVRIAISEGLEQEGYRAVDDYSIIGTSQVDVAKSMPPGFDLIVLDNHPAEASYWTRLLAPLRKAHPSAMILLVTLYGENEIRHWVDLGTSSGSQDDRESVELLRSDPLIEFLRKEANATSQSSDHLRALVGYATRLADKLKTGLELERKVFFAALASSVELLQSNAASLVVQANDGAGKFDTKVVDQIAERHLADTLLPEQHRYNVVICTEERGVHNELHRRVQAPDFFVFSDPFDGSTLTMNYTRTFLAEMPREEAAETTLADLFTLSEFKNGWPARDVFLNSPMISMVICERHRVRSAILVSLMTGDVYAAVRHGVFIREFKQDLHTLGLVELQASVEALTTGTQEALQAGWEPIDFKKTCPDRDRSKLLLCQMRARPLMTKGAKGRRSIYQHFPACVVPLLPWSYDIAGSFGYRADQWDFTPGPGRVLFLLDSNTVRNYEERLLDGRSYAAVISSGEPITEWIGWFAFLRHAPGIGAYCLRSRKGDLLPCSHKGSDTDAGVATPPEILSIFKNGYMDLFVLHASYGTSMQQYRDTLALIFNDDEDWSETGGITGFFGRDDFVKIATL